MGKNNNHAPFRIYKRGDTWHAYISVRVNGHRFVVRETTRCQDETAATQYCIKRINSIQRSPAATGEITLDAAADKWYLEHGQYLSPFGTESRLKNLVLEIGPDTVLSQITKHDISNFIAKCRARGRKNSTINRYLALLSSIITRARDYWEYNTPDVKLSAFKLPEPKENIKFFKDWQTIQKLINAAAPHIRPIILTALYTGLRRGRILSLKWEQVDFDNNIIIYMGKDGQPKSVPMVKPLRDMLLGMPHTCEYVFTFRGHRIYEFKNAWKQAFIKSGVPYLNFHALRHTTATWLLRSSGNLRMVQQVLGHTNINTTTKYAHLVNAATEIAMNNLFKKD